MKSYWLVQWTAWIFPLLFAHFFGFFDACQTMRKDYGVMDCNRIVRYMKKKPAEYWRWYLGGNSVYPPGNPFKCDFWHFMKHCWTFCLSGMALSCLWCGLVYPHGYALIVLYGLMYGIEGHSFSFYYAYVFRSDRNFAWYWHYVWHDYWKTQS